jgi:hypothetical protein
LFLFYNENQRVLSDIREVCVGLLSADAFERYQELCKLDAFNKHGNENRRSNWETLIAKCIFDDEEIYLTITNVKLLFETTLKKGRMMSAITSSRMTS